MPVLTPGVKLLVVTLQQMAAVCKPDGKLILLQHGKASWSWLNQSLDQGAQAHFAKWGCWWNRDILQLVYEVQHVLTCHLSSAYGKSRAQCTSNVVSS